MKLNYFARDTENRYTCILRVASLTFNRGKRELACRFARIRVSTKSLVFLYFLFFFFVSRSRCIGKLIRCECRLFLFPDVSHGSSAARQAMNFTSEKNCTVPGELNANFRVLSLADRVSKLLGEFRIGGQTFSSFVQLMNAFFCSKIVLYFGHFIYKTGLIVHRSLGAI